MSSLGAQKTADPESAELPVRTGVGPPLAYVAASVLAQLGGRYRVLADRLPRGTGVGITGAGPVEATPTGPGAAEPGTASSDAAGHVAAERAASGGVTAETAVPAAEGDQALTPGSTGRIDAEPADTSDASDTPDAARASGDDDRSPEVAGDTDGPPGPRPEVAPARQRLCLTFALGRVSRSPAGPPSLGRQCPSSVACSPR